MNPFRASGLHVDLSRSTVERETLSAQVYSDLIGGRGLCAFLLMPFSSRAAEDPEVPLIFATGPLCATGMPVAARLSVATKSPLTGTLFDASAGGEFPLHLRRAGFVYLRITGAAKRPTILTIDGETASLAPDPWRPGLGDPGAGWAGGAASVGAAALSGCRFAAIRIDGRFLAARGGLGTAMASKNLYRILVRGAGTVPVADPAALSRARDGLLRLFEASPALTGPYGIARFGTATLFDVLAVRRMAPARNFRETALEDLRALSATAIDRTFGMTGYGCGGCGIACRKMGRDGRLLPELDGLSHFGPLNGNGDAGTVVAAWNLCHESGLDAVSAAATVSCYGELTGRAFTGSRLLDLLRKIVAREGEGDLLAEGSWRVAASFGRPDLSMSVKRLELPAFDPRGVSGTALALATSTRGACAGRAFPAMHEILRTPIGKVPAAADRSSFAGKARLVKRLEDVHAACASLPACRFALWADADAFEEVARGYRAVTGLPKDAEDLLRDGERIVLAERLGNARAGLSRKDDDLPPRFFAEPGSAGGGALPPLDRDAFQDALTRYYACRGCDADGIPLPEALAERGLDGGAS
jgi:aldehyde:ferredoxin oxidoreductase